jgi:uracil-DNA glycosylase
VLTGQYAQAYYLGARRKKTLTDTIRAFDEYMPRYLVLPHPSWRSRIWMKKNPWFEKTVLPKLRRACTVLNAT